MYFCIGSLFQTNLFNQASVQDQQYSASSNSSSLESISNTPVHNVDFSMLNEPPGFSKYRISAIQGTLASLACETSGFQYIPQIRTTYGSEGKQIRLKSNHFAIKMQTGYIYQYSVLIHPDRCPKQVNRYHRIPKYRAFILGQLNLVKF